MLNMALMKKIIIILTLFTLSFYRQSFAQEAKGVLRIEVPARLDVQRYHLVPLEKNGFLIFYESNEVNKNGKRKWYFGLFDTKLKQKWLTFLPLTNKLMFVEKKRHGNTLLFLFKNSSKIKSDYGFYEIVKYDISTAKFSQITGTMPLNAIIKGFDFYGKTACIGIDLDNDKADLLFLNVNTGDVTPYKFDRDKNVRLEMVTYDGKNNEFLAFAKIFNGKYYEGDKLFVFNNKGKVSEEINIENNKKLNVLRKPVLVNGENGSRLFLGTYDVVTGSTYRLKDYENEETARTGGLFSLKFSGKKQEFLKFYDFLSFKNIPGTYAYRSYNMGKSPDGKNIPMASLFNVSSFEVKEVNNQYVVSLEVYKPYYRTETRMDYDFYGRPYPNTYEIFDGYMFYDVIIAGFTKTGKYIWDNDFPLNDIHTYRLDKHVMAEENEGKLILSYVSGDKIKMQLIEGPSDIGNEESVKIAGKFIRDRVVDSDNQHIVHWYDNYFLVYGYQKIANRVMKDQNYRTVFYVNKVAFQ
jgi:hypothetical protein